MDRPEKYNAIDEQMHGELARVWADVSADPDMRVAVVTGAVKAFGGDLAMVKRMAGDHDRVAHMLSEMSDPVYNMINCAKPIISRSMASPSAPAQWSACSPTSPSARSTPGSATATSKLGVAAGDHAAILWPLCGRDGRGPLLPAHR
jgi:enoyl-CoA hydratase